MNYIQPDWPAPAHVKAYTTSRHSWQGRTLQPNANEALQTLFSLPSEPTWLKQTHSTIVVEAAPENKETNADASFSATPDQVCAVLTADCLPVLICDRNGTKVAAIHAGWRGLAGGIIENTLTALNHPPEDLLVWLGPAIGPEKFEVGMDVYQAFTARHQESKQAFTSHTPDKWLANLYTLAKIRLNHHGVTAIYGGDRCTYTEDQHFFSYRRDQGNTGRMVSLIWLQNK